MDEINDKTIEDLQVEVGHLFQDTTKIFIPKKLEYNLTRFISKKELKKIHSDLTTAIELCMIVVSQLNSTLYSEDKYKALNSTILQSLVSRNGSNTYKKILELMNEGTKTGSIIDVLTYKGVKVYTKGVTSRHYKLGDAYKDAGLTLYTLKSEYVKNLNANRYWKMFKVSMTNPICSNVAKFYGKIELPTTKELLAEGKRLVKEKFTTKKGKILTLRNKHKDNYWKDFGNRSFVEDNIDMFIYLTSNGFILPTAGNNKSGGRVVDSIALMPSWIRNMIKIDGVKLSECDYTCLHPNLAVNIYEGDTKFITHKKVADILEIEVKKAKIEHLSFFNKDQSGMEKSDLWNYYMEYETNMMSNILCEKEDTDYRRTSSKLFSKEVELMTNVIKKLNINNIFVGYVYDALICEPKDYQFVCDTMDETAAEMNIYTKVGRIEVEQEPIVEEIVPQIEENPSIIELSDVTIQDIKNIIDGKANTITNWDEIKPLMLENNWTIKEFISLTIYRPQEFINKLIQII